MHARALDTDWGTWDPPRTADAVLPWAHIAAGLHQDFIWNDWQEPWARARLLIAGDS